MSNIQLPLPGVSGRKLQAGEHVSDREFLSDASEWEFFTFTTKEAAKLFKLLDPPGSEDAVADQLEAEGVEINAGLTPEAAAFAAALSAQLGADL